MMRLMKPIVFVGAVALAALTPSAAQAAKQWDAGTAIEFVVTGTDDPIAPSNNGSNGPQTEDFTIKTYKDADHWIDPDESPPENEDSPTENLPYSDINASTDAPSPGGLSQSGSKFTYTAPEVGGDYAIKFTGTDRSQSIGSGEGGDRHDVDNTDNWWDLDPKD